MSLRWCCFFSAFSFSCLPALELPPGAQLVCADDDECPSGTVCLREEEGAGEGLCVPADSPCVNADGAPVGDGTPCGDGVCVAGVCRAPGCGDGIVDQGAGEECDPVVDARCRADCTLPFCGDGIVDANESCDDASFSCRACVLLCIGDFNEADDEVIRRSNCDLATENGCECDAEPVLTLPDDGYVWQSETVGEGEGAAVYFVVNTPRDATLYRFTEKDGAEQLLGPTLFMSLSQAGGVAFVLYDFGTGEPTNLARLDGAVVNDLRGGLFTQDLIDFAIVHDGADIVTSLDGGLFIAPIADEGAAPVAFSDACAGVGDLIACAGSLYCSHADDEVVRAVDPVSGAAEDVYAFSSSSSGGPPRLLCHEGAPLLHDLGALFVIDGTEPVVLARFSSAGSNNFAPLHSAGAGRLLLTEAFGAAGPYGHLFELATGRLTPATRGFPLSPLGDVLLTDDSTDTPTVARVRVTP